MIVVSTLMLVAAGWLFVYIGQKVHEADDERLATLKTWPEITQLAGSRFDLQTIWRSGRINYKFALYYSRPLRRSWDQAAVTIVFLDKDGFKLFQQRVPMSDSFQFFNVGNKDQNPDGVSWKGDEAMNDDLYRRVASLDIYWEGFPALPPLSAKP